MLRLSSNYINYVLKQINSKNSQNMTLTVRPWEMSALFTFAKLKTAWSDDIFKLLSDLFLIYKHPLLDPDSTPKTLQNKVQMDLRYYFVRRGSENIYNWTKNTFRVVTEKGITFVEKTEDKETKNHKETDNEIITGFMPEIKNSKMCPVLSYTTYISALSPESDKLFQQPKYKEFKANKKVWYGPGPVGQNTLDSFITKICENMNMKDKGYTNHSLRVSAITNLTRNNFSNKQIMAISGHKSIESLAIYQKVNTKEKLEMILTLGYTLLNAPVQQQAIAPAQIRPSTVPAIMPSPQKALEFPPAKRQKLDFECEDPIPNAANMAVAIPSTSNTSILMEDQFEVSDQELMQIITETANTMEMTQYSSECQTTSTSKVTKQVVEKKTSPKMPIFQNCTFTGNVTFQFSNN